MNESIHFNPAQPVVTVEFTAQEIDDLLGDLPGGQSVSEATRRFHQCLHEMRKALKQRSAAAALHPPTLMLLEGDASTQHPQR